MEFDFDEKFIFFEKKKLKNFHFEFSLIIFKISAKIAQRKGKYLSEK